jgi:ammonium transporter Rh
MKQKKAYPYKSSLRSFAYWILVYEFVVVLLYAYYVRNSTTVASKHLENYYPWFQDVNTMMLIGFGFLMTFVRTHSWGSLAFTFIINSIVMQAYIIFHGFWGKVFKGFTNDPFIYLDIPTLTFGSYAVAGMLIALGALLGRVTPAQMLFMSVIGSFMYSLNERLVYDVLKVVDVGGSITIHTFGGYFGLAVSLALGKKNPLGGASTTVSYHSTMFSMFGTLFLWMFWPSFNSGAMPSGTSDSAQLRLWTITNTLLSLTGSCLSTFITSKFWRGKLHM